MFQLFRKSVPFILILILNSIISEGQQLKSFSGDVSKFLSEMQGFLAETNKKEAEKIIEDEFGPVWNTKFSAADKTTIVNTSNSMLKKRLKAFPDFVNYIQALIGFTNANQSAQTFTNWHTSLDKLLKTVSARKFSDFIEICSGLFASNTLFESANVKWVSSNNEYSFEFDTLPKVVFRGMTLTCYAKKDSSVIYDTKGSYYPNLNSFYGNGGRVNWLRAGIPESEAVAQAKKYVINLKSSEVEMDSVSFSYGKFFSTPLTGHYSDKLLADVKPESATYPRFSSYNVDMQMKDLIKGADYRGGFSMNGNKLIGSGNKNGDARFTFLRNGKPQMVLSSKSFVVKPDKVVSDNAAATLFSGTGDSLFHPGLEMKFNVEKRELVLFKNTTTGISSPYFDSYHKMNMYFDELVWKIDDPLIDLKMTLGAGESKLLIESQNLFDIDRYNKIQGLAETNPLATIKQFAEKNNSKIVYTQDLAKAMRMNDNQVRNLMLSLSATGFVSFDFDNDRAIIKDKLYYYLQARSGKIDYDGIYVESVISGKPNATINLLNFDLDMRGVSRVVLSDSQRVYLVPNEQEMTVRKNRDIHFSGRVHAGRLDFYGKDFDFSYEDFNIDLKNVDSLRLKIPADSIGLDGKPVMASIKSVLQNLKGNLAIDQAGNKSGVVDNPNYPIFNSTGDGYVFYDYPTIFNGVYKRDNFYFKTDPFELDSLNNLDKKGVHFDGTLASAGIFPDFKEVLTVQKDYSLGFIRNTPSTGFAAYGGKGKYTDEIALSNQGLRGNGIIDYLSSTSHANNIFFFPDSTLADAQDIEVRKETVGKTAYPQISGKEVFINWRPKSDKMYVFKKQNLFYLYDKQATLDGNLVLATSGVTANGVITYAESQLISENFNIKQTTYGADTSDFQLTSNDVSVLALSSKNVKSIIDLERRFGEFTSNGKGSYVSFPLNQYICYIQTFKWYMDNREVEFSSVKGSEATKMNIEGSEFISTNPEQDSLRFNAPLASYSLKDYLIKAQKVPKILVADASIIPDSGKVVIEKQAVMRPLVNSRVIANTTTKYHTMLNTTINISGRKKYSGIGDYEYLDQTKVKHLIKLSQIGVDTSFQTFANGEIPDTADFFLGPNIQYKGNLKILASKQNLFFSGYSRVNHHCEQLTQNWFSFAGDIDPAGVNVPVKEPKNEAKDKLYTGIYFSSDSTTIYGAFLSPKQKSTDGVLIEAEGLLSYDDKTKEFKVAESEAMAKEQEKKKEKEKEETVAVKSYNAVILEDKNCLVRGEGKVDFGVNYGQFQLNNFGVAWKDLSNDSLTFDGAVYMKFLFAEDALKFMADQVISHPVLQPTNDSRPVLINALKNMVGTDKSNKMIAEINLYGSVKKVPSEIESGIMLSDVKVYFDKEKGVFRNKGLIGIGTSGKSGVSRLLTGYMEVMHRRSGDVFNLYFELDPQTWYYFYYARGTMQAISSEAKFNDAIDKVKPEKRISEDKNATAPYQYMLSTERKKAEFLRKWNESKTEEEK